MGRLSELGRRFKEIESKYEQKLNPEKFTVIRLDGHKFHRWTKQLEKPFDIRIILAFVNVINYLHKRLGPIMRFAYAQSDEVSLILFPRSYVIKTDDLQDLFLPYNLRMQKLVSLLASFTATEFHKNFKAVTKESVRKIQHSIKEMFDSNSQVEFNIPNYPPNFDCRIFQLDSMDDVAEYIKWRRIDAIRNSKNMFAYYFLSHKQCLNLTSNQRIQMVKEKFGADYYLLPSYFKVGLPMNFDKHNHLVTFGFTSDPYGELLDIMENTTVQGGQNG